MMPFRAFRHAMAWAMIAAAGLPVGSRAENPIVQTSFTADPAPLVHDGVVYLYAGHDEDDADNFKMRDWMLYTSTDMVNWTDQGVVASLATFPWAVQDNDAWAPQVIERDGKFYLYAPVSVPGWPKNVIGVAVADSPRGPFRDALGHPLIDKAVGFFDPTVAIDDDGQAYLYWGNPDLWYVKLNKDMISYSGKITKVASKPKDYQEGPWFYRRGKNYYMAYASTCCPEGIGYAMAKGPVGPWIPKGHVMDPTPLSTGNHPGIIDYKSGSYVFGFSYRLNFADTPIHHERRSINVARFDYAADGSIPKLPWWNDAGVPQVEPLDPYRRVEAETTAWTSRVKRDRDRAFDWAPGVKTARSDTAGMYVTRITDLSYIKVAGIDFGRGAARFVARVASGAKGGRIELRLDAPDGRIVGTAAVPATGGWDRWTDVATPVDAAAGSHALYLVFRGDGNENLFNFDHWRFERKP